MPAVEEPKPTPTAAPKPINPVIPAESPADRFRENPKGDTDGGTSMRDFSADLSRAQVKDGAKPASAAPAPREEPPLAPAPRQEPAATPKVPSLPQAEEWRPKGEKAGQQWDALKAKHSEAEARWNAERELLQKQIDATKSNSGPEFDVLKQERDKYREILRDVAIERDPEFKKAYEPREKAAMDAAVMAAGDKGEKLSKLMAAPNSPWKDEQINKIIEDLPASAQRRVNAALAVMEQVDVERTSEIARRRASFDEKQSALMSHQREVDSARAKMMDIAFQETEKDWKQRHPFFVEKKGDDAHNSEVAQSIALAKAIYSGELSPQELAQASMWAASGERVLKGWQSAIKRAEAAEAALDKIRGVQPGGGNEGDRDEGGAETLPAPGHPDYLKAFNNRLREAQAKDQQGGGRR